MADRDSAGGAASASDAGSATYESLYAADGTGRAVTAAYTPPALPSAALPAAQAPAMLPEPGLQYSTPGVPTSSPTLQSMAPVMPLADASSDLHADDAANLTEPFGRYPQSVRDDYGGATSDANLAAAVDDNGRKPGSRPVGAFCSAPCAVDRCQAVVQHCPAARTPTSNKKQSLLTVIGHADRFPRLWVVRPPETSCREG